MTAPGRLLEEAMLGEGRFLNAAKTLEVHAQADLILVVPYGTRAGRSGCRVPRDTARWLWRRLGEALGEPRRRPRRRVRLRRGVWLKPCCR